MVMEIARTDLTPAQLRATAGKTKDGRAARRMLAIALVLEGTNRTMAAKTCGLDRQTLRDWVHRYNAEGLAGLDMPPFSRSAGAAVAGAEGRDRRAGGGGPRSGVIHMDINHLPKLETTDGERRTRTLFLAIDRCSRWVHLAVQDDEGTASAIAFPKKAIGAAPFRITHVLTDRGSCFTAKALEAACRQLTVQHRTTKPTTPQINGLVERFNGRGQREGLGSTSTAIGTSRPCSTASISHTTDDASGCLAGRLPSRGSRSA